MNQYGTIESSRGLLKDFADDGSQSDFALALKRRREKLTNTTLGPIDKNDGESGVAVLEWIGMLGAAVAFCIGLVSFVYREFETKEHATEISGRVEKRLDRIDDKLDTLLSR